jgi:hypothetical protein
MNDKESNEFLQYQVVASRRQETDSLMWQVPVLSLTAQAFLFSIALNPGAGHAAKILSAGLALVSSLTSIQLMAKHRHHEVTDSKWLEKFEQSHSESGFLVIHGKRPKPVGRRPWRFLIGLSSYKVWMFALSMFAMAALTVLFFPSWFCS